MASSGDAALGRGAAAREAVEHLLPRQPVLPHVDETGVAVLLLDITTSAVTYANPAALALTGDRALLPSPADRWSAAARLLAPADGAGRADWADPVQTVARGESVTGVQVVLQGDDGTRRPFWVTGSPLVSGAGTGDTAMVALFPVREPSLSDGVLASAALWDGQASPTRTEAAALAGADGAALARADGVARAAVDSEERREVESGRSPSRTTTRDVDELTARALVASTISFTISDPRREDDPLIWVNPAFERMTGYRAEEVLGRNCRFLQGPGTDRAELDRIRHALRDRESIRTELLNYRSDGTAFWNSLTISPVFDGHGRLTHFVGVQTDVTTRVLAGLEHERLLAAEREARETGERIQAQLDVLVRVGAVLGETLDADEAMRRLADTVVPDFVDFCTVDVFDSTEGLSPATPAEELIRRRRRVAAAHVDPHRAALLRRAAELDAHAPEASLVPLAVRSGEAVLVPVTDEAFVERRSGGSPALREVIAELSGGSGSVVPLVARGRVLGALTFGTGVAGDRVFGEADLGLAEGIATRAALALDNARLFEAESVQRRRADALAAAGAALAVSLRSPDVVDVLLDRVVPAFADLAFVHVDESASPSLRDPGGPAGLHHVASRHRDPARAGALAAFLEEFRVPAGQPGTGQAWSSHTPVVVQDVDGDLVASPLVAEDQRGGLRALGLGTVAAVPLTARGVTFGVLTIARTAGPDGAAPRGYTSDELHFVAELGRRGALALENARLYESERIVALELQRSLLPARLPHVPGLDVAGRYLAGAAGTEVGGDWYDVVPLPDGRVAVAVGDVMGRGVRAAAVMGQLRAALRSYAVEGLAPAHVLERLAAFTDLLEGEHLVTCLVGVHDPATGQVTVASAGHLPPLLLGPAGSAFVPVRPGLPLGVPEGIGGADGAGGPAERYPQAEVTLPPGTALVLFTDGLVEDRDISVGAGLDRLAELLSGRRPATADEACDDALRAMGRDASHDDDTAVLVLRAVEQEAHLDGTHGVDGVTPGLRMRLDPEASSVALARRAVTEVFTDMGMADQADVAQLLTSELVTNALRHGDAPVELHVDVDDARATVAVVDGSSEPPHPRPSSGPGAVRVVEGGLGENGRGLLIVRALADDWGWNVLPGGKMVFFRLRRSPS